MRGLWLLLLTTGILSGGCAPYVAPVPIFGDQEEVAGLAGEWVGDYSSAASGRSGSILFRIEAGADTAYGDVVMVPGQDPYNFSGEHDHEVLPTHYDLGISFVAVGQGEVSGRLDPYRDPVCGCEVNTTFTGRLDGSRIEGTYETVGGPLHPVHTGRWSVVRRPGN